MCSRIHAWEDVLKEQRKPSLFKGVPSKGGTIDSTILFNTNPIQFSHDNLNKI